MSESFAERLSRAWYQSAAWPWLFLPFTCLYALIVFLRKRVSKQPPKNRVPIIVVGNITVGGTGKSPLVSHLVRYFESKSLRVGVVSRGYGVGIPKSEVREVHSDSGATEVGDEPLMLKRMLGCDIALSPTRSNAVRFLENKGVELIISDDGLQHLAMHRDVEVCVIDGERGLGNGMMLPVGPLRESARRLSCVDAIVINGESDAALALPDQVYSTNMLLVPQEFVRLDGSDAMSVDAFVAHCANQAVSAIAGIGNPARFFTTLARLGIDAHVQGFPDHHAYQSSDFVGLNDLVVMTEKDAAKCRALDLANAWYLRVEPELQDKLGDKLYNLLKEKARL